MKRWREYGFFLKYQYTLGRIFFCGLLWVLYGNLICSVVFLCFVLYCLVYWFVLQLVWFVKVFFFIGLDIFYVFRYKKLFLYQLFQQFRFGLGMFEVFYKLIKWMSIIDLKIVYLVLFIRFFGFFFESSFFIYIYIGCMGLV